MEKVQPQRTELYEYLHTYMEELFQDSCSAVQTILDTDSAKIWEHFQDAVRECLEKTKSLQQQNQKGILHYLAFSLMQYAPFLDRLELRIDALDDGFYLDTQEASAHYHADFLQDRFLQDLIFLYEKAAEKFIRIQHFEQVQIRQNYAVYYDSLLFQMIKALTGLILETVEESGVHAADSLRIICGDYMDHAVVLYAHGHPEEACQQKLTGARRASRGR